MHRTREHHDRGHGSAAKSRLLIAAIAVSVASCSSGDASDSQAANVGARPDSATTRDTLVSAGEVSTDSAAASAVGRWITDANVLALVGVMNSRQIAAADAELEGWHSDPVRAFASTVAREHAELQHSVDSVAERMHTAPVAPALAAQLSKRMQSQIDSMTTFRTGTLDRAFVREQVAANQLMSDEIAELTGAARSPDLRTVLSSIAARVANQLAAARSIHATLSASDSLAAVDSARRRASRIKP